MNIYIWIYIHVCIWVYICIWTYVHKYMYIYIYICIYICSHIHIYNYIHIYMCNIYKRIHTYIYICMYTYKNIHNTHTPTYINTHRVCINASRPPYRQSKIRSFQQTQKGSSNQQDTTILHISNTYVTPQHRTSDAHTLPRNKTSEVWGPIIHSHMGPIISLIKHTYFIQQ